MKKLLVLPGYSSYNKEWADTVEETFKNNFEDFKIYVHYWSHWQEKDDPKLKILAKIAKFEAKNELEAILEHVSKGDDIYVIAKSIGTFVTMHLMSQKHLNWQKVILCGIPLKVILGNKRNLYKNLNNINATKIVIFQNDKDPFSPYEKIEKFVKNINPDIKVIKKERDDHEYPFYEEFESILNS